MVVELLLAAAAAVLLAPVPYFAVRRSRVEGPLLHVTTAERVSSITAGVPEGWIHLQPGRRWSHRMPLVGWPPHPFQERIYFYRGQEWPGRFRLRFNLPDPEECTHGVVVTVADLAAFGGPGCLYRRRIDGSVAWSGEYRGPGRVIERASDPWAGSRPASRAAKAVPFGPAVGRQAGQDGASHGAVQRRR